MRTISIIGLAIILTFKLSGQCNKIVIPKVTENYEVIETIKINMSSTENSVSFSPFFMFYSNYEYKIMVVNAEGYSTNAEVKLFEDGKLIGTNYASENKEVYSEYSFMCQKTKSYSIKVSKIHENEEYCGKLLLLVKKESLQNNSNKLSIPLTPDPSIYIIVEKMPKFKENSKNGISDFTKWSNSHEKVKKTVQQTQKTGKVYVEIVVDKEGNVVAPRIVRGINPTLDNTAVEIVKSSTKWYSPGLQRGVPKNVQFTVCIDFKKEYLE